MHARMCPLSSRFGLFMPLVAVRYLLLVLLAGAWSASQAYETVPDGKFWETDGVVYYVRSSMNTLYVDDGTNTGDTIDFAHWYRRSGEVLMIEQVPYNGFTTGSYWQSGNFYAYYQVWTDYNTSYRWGKFATWRLDDSVSSYQFQWGNSLTINLQADNGQYVSAVNGGGQGVTADRNVASAWEEITLWGTAGGPLQSGDEVVLGTRDNQKFFCAEGGGGQAVVANRSTPYGWERFHIYKQSGGDNYIRSGDTVAFKADNGQYWSATNGGGSGITADRNSVYGYETFTLTFITPGSR